MSVSDNGFNRNESPAVLGMLYIVRVRLIRKHTGEKEKRVLLVVGNELADIEMKLRWAFDMKKYASFSITDVQKVREKIHTIHTTVTHCDAPSGPVVKQGERTVVVNQEPGRADSDQWGMYAVGITTRMGGASENHALRRVAAAIMAASSDNPPKTAPSLSDDATLCIEEVGRKTGVASPRDVSSEKNRAHFVRG